MTKEKKLRLAIYDFTDCEGCEVQLVSLLDIFLALEKRVEIINWRLGQEENQNDNFDICLIEGTPLSRAEQNLLKSLRQKSRILIALGACAATGGIPAMISRAERKRLYRLIYGPNYRPRGIDSLPLSSYVKVDYFIPGCPADKNEINQTLGALLAGKQPQQKNFPVCLECKAAGNDCRLLNHQPCLGPITQAGCRAVCVSGGNTCYGCRGALTDANLPSYLQRLSQFMTTQEIQSFVSVFLRATPVYKKLNQLLKTDSDTKAKKNSINLQHQRQKN